MAGNVWFCTETESRLKTKTGLCLSLNLGEDLSYHVHDHHVRFLQYLLSTFLFLLYCEQVQEFGVCEVRDLKPNGANILVTEENKKEYVHLVCQMRMTGVLGHNVSSGGRDILGIGLNILSYTRLKTRNVLFVNHLKNVTFFLPCKKNNTKKQQS